LFFQQINDILREYHQDTPFSNVLSNTKLMKLMDFGGLDCQATFKSISTSIAPKDVGTCDEKLLMNLCLSQHYAANKKNRRIKVSFDINSTCCFSINLAIAC